MKNSLYQITHYDNIFDEIHYHMIANQKFKEKQKKIRKQQL